MEAKIVFDANVAYSMLIAALKAGVAWQTLKVYRDAFQGQQFADTIFNAVEPQPGKFGWYIIPERNVSLIRQCMFGE